MKKGGKKRNREEANNSTLIEEETPQLTRGSEEEPPSKKSRWTNKSRVLVLSARGISFRGRHLMDDLKSMLPHSKTESKMQKRESLFMVNEMAEMKNCTKCLLFEGRKKKDIYLWAANIAKGPSAKFEVENIHTMAELKMTGNCLRATRPLLSFDKSFTKEAHWELLAELLTQIFGVPNHHPKSQPFYDHVFTFSVVDGKIWFRNYQIVEETGSLAEIGPRMVLNPVKIFEGSFTGETLWENPKYVTPNMKRSLLKKMKSKKYLEKVQAKASYEAGRPKDSTYKVDTTEEVFQTMDNAGAVNGDANGVKNGPRPVNKSAKKKKKKKKGAAAAAASQEEISQQAEQSDE